jgi:hypothetical protein
MMLFAMKASPTYRGITGTKGSRGATKKIRTLLVLVLYAYEDAQDFDEDKEVYVGLK